MASSSWSLNKKNPQWNPQVTITTDGVGYVRLRLHGLSLLVIDSWWHLAVISSLITNCWDLQLLEWCRGSDWLHCDSSGVYYHITTYLHKIVWNLNLNNFFHQWRVHVFAYCYYPPYPCHFKNDIHLLQQILRHHTNFVNDYDLCISENKIILWWINTKSIHRSHVINKESIYVE